MGGRGASSLSPCRTCTVVAPRLRCLSPPALGGVSESYERQRHGNDKETHRQLERRQASLGVRIWVHLEVQQPRKNEGYGRRTRRANHLTRDPRHG